MKKDLFNLRLKSKLLLFSLFALLAGGVSPAWAADPITDDFTSYTAPSSGDTVLGDNWVIIGNDGSYSCFGSNKDFGFYKYDSGNEIEAYVYGNYASNYSKANWLVLKKVVSGVVIFDISLKSGQTVYVTKVNESNGTFTATGSVASYTSTNAAAKFDAGTGGTYIAFCLNGKDNNKYPRLNSVTYTEYEAISGPAFVVMDESKAIKSDYSYNFGLATAGTEKTFTLSNPGTEALTVSVSESGNFGATLSASSIAAGGEVTLTLTMPAASGSSVVTITPDAASGIDPFVINVSGTIRDANKIYETLGSKPEGWTTTGTWSFNETSGATTTAWYLSSNARLITPLLTVANDEVFIFEAKGNYEDYHALKVEYSADGTNWTASQTSIEMTSEWQTVTISDIPAGEYYIALHTAYSSIRNFYGGEKVPGANFAINTDGSTQNFGSVKFGETAQKSYTVTNSGNADLSISFASSGDFTVLNNFDASGKTLKLTDNFNWESANVYAWDKDGNPLLGEWPGTGAGTVINDYGETQFVLHIPDGAVGLIFNNGNGLAQTEDITDFGYEGYWMDGTKDNLGHYKVTGYDPIPITLTVNAGGSKNFTVSMNTATSGDKSGNVQLTFDALNVTEFTIPCTGNVKDANYLYVDFADGIPAGWQAGTGWVVESGYAYQNQSNDENASALVTIPLTVAENEELTFEAAKKTTGQGTTASLMIRYSQNGGVTWIDHTTYSVDASFSSKTLSGVPAGDILLQFYGHNVKIDNIEGFTKTNAAAIALAEGTADVANGDTKDFGFLNANGTTYTVKNIGNATLNATITGEGVTVSPASIEVAAGATADITVTMVYGEPYGPKTGKMTIDSDGWVGDFEVNFTAELVDPDALVVDFESGMPAGWYLDTWTVSGGTAHINEGGAKPMITELVGAEEGKNTLTFDAKLKEDYGYGTYTLDVYTSTDRKDWGDPKTFTLTGTSQTFSLDALSNGNYYVKFKAANASIDNIKGVKKLAAPEHDLYMVEATVADREMMPIDTYTATVKVASLRADEEVTADLYFGETKVGTTTQTIASGATATITVEGNAPAAGAYEVKVVVSAGAITFEAGKANVTVADKTELAITNFAPVAKNVQADNNNMFTAEFNVTVKNNGSVAVDAATIGINITDDKDLAYEDVTKSIQTVFLVPGAYTTDNAKLFIYRWSTAEDEEWDEFTKIADNLYSADLNGKAKFVIVRKANDASAGFDGAWNQSVDLTAADGACFTFQGWDNKDGENHHYFTAGDVDLPYNATLKLNLAVTAPAGDGGAFKFKAQENKTNSWWDDGYGTETVTVNVTAAPIVLDETVGTVVTGNNRKVQLKHTFVEGWNTVCLPFSIDAYRIHMQAKALAFTAYDSEKNELTFSPATTLEAGKPYVIYVPAAITEPFEFTGVTIASTEAGKSEFNGVTFQGTYAPMSAGSLEGKWGLTAAGKIVKASATTTMKGFRAYFDNVPSNARVVFLDDDATGISTIAADGNVESAYNLHGQKVEDVKKGLYIVNGKKQIVK